MEQKFVHVAAVKLTNRLNAYIGKEGLELKKMELGMEVILINITKFMAIYTVAALLDVIPQTAIVHSAFILLKRFSFGLHALNSTVCTVISSLMLAVVPWLVQGFEVGNITVFIAFTFAILCLYKYAPADTKAKPLVGANNRMHLRNKAIAAGVVLMAIALAVPNGNVKLLLVIGAAYQCIAILPATYKILKRSEKNYEQYEGV